MDQIGRYRLTQRLGAGSFATVYRGHDDDLDVPVAVKVLAENWCQNDDVRGRFLSEARLMRRINDERIVRVYDIGTLDDDRPYFVMDFANGGSLEDLRRNLTEPGRALRLCAEAARALEVLHRHSVIHRDVTPGNILLNVTSDGTTHVLLADLGVAKSLVGEQGATMTAGTPAYMAIEQATGVGTLDQRADIYSIGAVTYALLTGHPPFPIKSLADLLSRNQNIQAAPIADRIGAPRELDHLLAAALSPNPAQRPATAGEFAEQLDRIADGLPGSQSYRPRPLPAAPTGPRPGTETSTYAPPMPGSFNAAVYGTGMPGSGMSLAQPPGQSSIANPHETPTSVMQSYIGGNDDVDQTEHKSSTMVWVWSGVAVLVIFAVGLLVFVLATGGG